MDAAEPQRPGAQRRRCAWRGKNVVGSGLAVSPEAAVRAVPQSVLDRVRVMGNVAAPAVP